MENSNMLEIIENHDSNLSKFVWHKISNLADLKNEHSLAVIFTVYFNTMVKSSSIYTENAKRYDFNLFYDYFLNVFKHDHIDFWTPSVSKDFQKYLETEKKFKGTSINRITATLRHAAKWIDRYRPFAGGYPFENVKRLREDDPAWKGITKRQLSLLKTGVDIRLKICTKKNQNPLLEAAIIYTLLCTGLRKFELIKLDRNQYDGKGLTNVKRKGNKITSYIALTDIAIEYIEQYLTTKQDDSEDSPLFCTKNHKRLNPTDVDNVILRIANQAQAQLPEDEKFKLSPHMFRHHFGKTVTEKKGLSAAKEMLGHVSWKNVFRYTRPSEEEKKSIIDECFA